MIVYDQEILKSQSFVCACVLRRETVQEHSPLDGGGGRVVLNLMSQLFLALMIRFSWSRKCYQTASFIRIDFVF